MAYSVGEVASMLDVPASTLRYYESQGLLPGLGRTKGGRRQFEERDVEACRVIECLKASGLSIKKIREFIELVMGGDTTIAQRRAIFEERRQAVHAEMEQLKRTLSVLDYKCWYYDTALVAGTESAVRDIAACDIPSEHRRAKALLAGEE